MAHSPIPALTPLRRLAPTPSAPSGPTPLRPQPPPPWRQRRLWAVLASVGVIVAGVTLWQRQQGPRAADLGPYTVLASSGELPGLVSASGELEAEQQVNVSPKRQGLLEELFVEEGDPVSRGQPVARMDSGDLDERILELQAQLRSAEAQLARSLSELQRNQRLFRENAISLSDFNAVRSTYEVDLATVQAARQRLEARRVEENELIVRAPFDGVITQRFADPGSFVTPTTTAASVAGATSSSIVELSQGLEVVAKVPESDIGRIRAGQQAQVRVDAFPDRSFAARVKRITPRAEKLNNVTSFDVYLDFAEPQPELRIGMTADVGFRTGAVQAETVVPTVAIVTEEGRPGVLLVDGDRQPLFQPVELGISSGRDTQILSGLEPGTRVFIDLPPWSRRSR